MSTDIEDGSDADDRAVEDRSESDDADDADMDPAERRCAISLNDHPDE
ncbi:hypothetical protein [Halomicrobium salinisoli]|nr:hypothetical protein [Halomicrobium salinisoli]